MNKKRILIVDDKESIRNLLSILLKREGYNFEVAKDGKDALTAIEASAENFDLIISDVDMPEMDGIEMARNISKNIPIIFISGRISSLQKAKQTTFPNFAGGLGKPFQFEELSTMVEKALLKKE